MKALELIEKVNGKFYESRRATQPKGGRYTCDWENAGSVDSVKELEKKVKEGVDKMTALATAILSSKGWKEEVVRRAGELQEVLKTFRFDPKNRALSAARMYQLETYANRMWLLESTEVRSSLPVEDQWIVTEKKEPAPKKEPTAQKTGAKRGSGSKSGSGSKKEPTTQKTEARKDAAADNQLATALGALSQSITLMLQQNQQILEILAAQKK